MEESDQCRQSVCSMPMLKKRGATSSPDAFTSLFAEAQLAANYYNKSNQVAPTKK